MRSIAIFGALAIMFAPLGVFAKDKDSAKSKAPKPVEVMVLGTYHFAGSDSDLVSVETDDVRSEKRQRELARVAEALAKFKPTAIAVERETTAPDFVDPKFAEFTPDALAKTKNEREQIGYRLAKEAGVTRVYGIDEQPSKGEPDYFPFGRVAEHATSSGQGEAFNTLLAGLRARIDKANGELARMAIADALIEANGGALSAPDFYYEIAKFDVGEDQPGAELEGYWFMRNAKIFSKLMQVAEPGDRIVVVYGAGHKFWLDHLAEHTPGFVKVDPVPYLKKAH